MANHLFLHLDEVFRTHNLQRRVCSATKHPANPVLPVGRLDEWDAVRASNWSMRSVLYDPDDRLFKCWYTGADLASVNWRRTGYAYSEDGVQWIKPTLGLFEYAGSTKNNICSDYFGAIVRDPTEPDASRRFKMVTKFNDDKREPAHAAYSPDGIHWTNGPVVDLPALQSGPDVVTLTLDEGAEDPSRRFRLIWQERQEATKPGPERVRVKCIAFGENIEKFTPSPDNPILQPNQGLEHENHFLMLARYGEDWVMPYEFGWYIPNRLGPHGQYAADVRLAVSKDGEHFSRICPTDKLIPRGERGRWDAGFLVVPDRPIVKDDTIYLLYSGQGEEWSYWPPGNIPESYGLSRSGSVRITQLGLATLRLDGFTCLQTIDREISGFMETPPLELAGAQVLSVNVADAMRARSWVDVEVLDPATNEPLPGFTRTESARLELDSLRAPVTWNGSHLGGCGKNQVRLRFHIHGAARLDAYSLT